MILKLAETFSQLTINGQKNNMKVIYRAKYDLVPTSQMWASNVLLSGSSFFFLFSK